MKKIIKIILIITLILLIVIIVPSCINFNINPKNEKFDNDLFKSLFTDDYIWADENDEVWISFNEYSSIFDSFAFFVKRNDGVKDDYYGCELSCSENNNTIYLYLNYLGNDIDVKAGKEKLVFYDDYIKLYYGGIFGKQYTLKKVLKTAKHYIYTGYDETLNEQNDPNAFVDDFFYYSLNTDGYGYTINAKNENIEGDIIIPAYVNGIPVVSIGSNSKNTYNLNGFKNCTKITSITIPDTIAIIGENAFVNCIMLNDIELPNSVYYVGNNTFAGCTHLEEVCWSLNCENINKNTFAGCVNLKQIKNTNCINTIGKRAFSYCVSLEEISLDNATSICDYSFEFCKNLKNIKLTNCLKDFGIGAFRFCYNLGEFYIPNSIVNLPSALFFGALNLEKIHFGENTSNAQQHVFTYTNIRNCYFPSLDNFLNIRFKTTTNLFDTWNLYVDDDLVKKIIIPEGIKDFTNVYFYGCNSVESIIFADDIYSFGTRQFENCKNLKEVVLPKNLYIIDINTFSHCDKLSHVEFNEGLIGIERAAFNYCPELETIDLPLSLKIVEDEAFLNCDKLQYIRLYSQCNFSDTSFGEGEGVNYYFKDKDYIYNSGIYYSLDYKTVIKADKTITGNVVLNSNVEVLSDYCFYGCNKINSVTLPNNVKSIGKNAFYGCKKMTKIQLPDSIEYIGNNCFNSCNNLRKINLPDSIEYIGNYCFSACNNLEKIKIPKNLKHIGEGCFSDCKGLIEISGGESLEELPVRVFDNCISLKEYVTPMNLKKISELAFYNCKSLEKIVLQDNLETIMCDFSSCDLKYIYFGKNVKNISNSALMNLDLDAIEISEGNTYFKKSDGCLYNYDYTILYLADEKMNGTIYVNNKVETIWPYAFYGNKKIENVVLPNSLKTIGKYAFSYCIKLNNVHIPSNVNVIEEGAFELCELINVEIEDGVKVIGPCAFYNNEKALVVNIPNSVIDIQYDSFNLKKNNIYNYNCDSYANDFFVEISEM